MIRKLGLCILLLLLPYVCFATWYSDYFTTLPTRASDHLTIPTPDATGELVHSSVLYFPNAWNGYYYWMAMTPFYNGDGTKENPCIVVSNNGITWVVPSGLTNPIATPDEDWFADSNLFYDTATSSLWYYWIDPDRHLYRSTSSNGTTWSAKSVIATLPADEGLASPCILKIGSTYYMWSVGYILNPNVMYRRQSTDGVTWTDKTACTWSGSFPSGQEFWHMEIQYIPTISQYWMLICTTDLGETSHNTQLVMAHSTDGLAWTVEDGIFLAGGTNESDWDHNQYKSSFQIINNIMHIWYSGIANPSLDWPNSSSWNVGYTTSGLTFGGSGDTTNPTCTITSPTSNPTYDNGQNATITLSGSASDNVGVTSVTWSNDRGGSGSATGTTSWSVSNINLFSGSNVITITAHDAANNMGSDVVTVTYTPATTSLNGVILSGGILQ
jgi:hypothetical protein